jgi:hypothetical protein
LARGRKVGALLFVHFGALPDTRGTVRQRSKLLHQRQIRPFEGTKLRHIFLRCRLEHLHPQDYAPDVSDVVGYFFGKQRLGRAMERIVGQLLQAFKTRQRQPHQGHQQHYVSAQHQGEFLSDLDIPQKSHVCISFKQVRLMNAPVSSGNPVDALE